jgi:hypothetical protein
MPAQTSGRVCCRRSLPIRPRRSAAVGCEDPDEHEAGSGFAPAVLHRVAGGGSQPDGGMLGFCEMVRTVAVPQTGLRPRIPLLTRSLLGLSLAPGPTPRAAARPARVRSRTIDSSDSAKLTKHTHNHAKAEIVGSTASVRLMGRLRVEFQPFHSPATQAGIGMGF